MIDIIGAPFDLCGKRTGSRLGPPAIRLAGLEKTLAAVGHDVCDLGDLKFSDRPDRGEGIRNADAAIPIIAELRSQVSRSIRAGRVPMMLGGDHSMAIGAVGGALESCGQDLALIWMDAHSDLNTPATSPSGNLHGMPVAALLGLESGVEGTADEQWMKMIPSVRLGPGQVAYFGLREMDPGERKAIASLSNSYTATMHEIDRHGIVSCIHRLDHWLSRSGASKIWISFDVDMLDPVLAPGTGTTVRGGLTYREAHLVAELLREMLDVPGCSYKLVGLDVVETNPLFDNLNETAKTVVEWVGSLFGKTILGNKGREP